MTPAIHPTTMRTFHEHEVFNGRAVVAGVKTNYTGQPVHAHDFLEIEVIAGGTGWHVTTHGRRPARAGNVFILRPGTWHGYEDCHELLIANTAVAPSVLRGEAAFLQEMPALRELLWLRPTSAGNQGVYATQVSEDQATEVADQIATLRRNLKERPRNRPLLLGHLLAILGTLAEHVVGDEPEQQLHPAVTAALVHLDAAPEHNWTVDELANTVSLDPAYLSRLFRRHVGLPPIMYLAHIRAERAAILLAQTAEPVSRIGALVGWPDPAYFTRRFRTLFGLTPTAYRRRSDTSIDQSTITSPGIRTPFHADQRLTRALNGRA